MGVELHDFSWEKMIEAVEAVHQRARRATASLQQAGIPYAVAGGSPRDAVHLVFAGEKVNPKCLSLSPDISESVPADEYKILSLDALVRMKLNSFRRKDQVHLLDMLDVGLVDSSWLPRLPPQHAERLQQLIDDPNG